MTQLPSVEEVLERLIDQRAALDLETLLTVERILTDPSLVASYPVAPEFNPRYRNRLSYMVDACAETRGEHSKCGTIWPLPKKASHSMHIFLASWTFFLPVDDPYVTTMGKNRAVGEMKLCVCSRRHARV